MSLPGTLLMPILVLRSERATDRLLRSSSRAGPREQDRGDREAHSSAAPAPHPVGQTRSVRRYAGRGDSNQTAEHDRRALSKRRPARPADTIGTSLRPSRRRQDETSHGHIAETLQNVDPALFVVDVSAEITLLARIMSVPAITIRMHGDRSDPGHLAGYEAAVGMLAPFDERIEQDDYPDWAKSRTFYSGGLCTTKDPVISQSEARAKLGLPTDKSITLVIAGGGGSGTPYAPLTVAARALPDALWLVAGPVHREGHETDFGNLRELGWIDNLTDYLCAADRVVASAGDNTVHEIARAEKPFLCVPEWRYFDEQQAKAAELAKLGAAVHLSTWPASIPEWQQALRATDALDVSILASLHNPDAAPNAARWLEGEASRLWSS